MGSLRAALALIFVWCQEDILFKITKKPVFHKWCVNDTVVLFSSSSENGRCFHIVDQLQQTLTFTWKIENNNNLPIPDVIVNKLGI